MCQKCKAFKNFLTFSKKDTQTQLSGTEFMKVKSVERSVCYEGCLKFAQHFEKHEFHQESILWYSKAMESRQLSPIKRVNAYCMMTIISHNRLKKMEDTFEFGEKTIQCIESEEQIDLTLSLKDDFFIAIGESAFFFNR